MASGTLWLEGSFGGTTPSPKTPGSPCPSVAVFETCGMSWERGLVGLMEMSHPLHAF